MAKESFPSFGYDYWLNLVNNTRKVTNGLVQMLVGFDGNVPANARTTEADFVSWDEVIGDRNVPAPFTRKCGPGVLMDEPKVQTKSIPFPYIEIFRPACCGTTSKRIPGTNGEQSRASRYTAELVDIAENLLGSWKTRLEVMARDILVKGSFVVEGPGIQTQEVDFDRDPTLDVVLSGAALWSATSTATPQQNMRDWELRVATVGNTSAQNYMFGIDAWARYSNTTEFKEKFKACCDKETGNQLMNPLSSRDDIMFMGTFEGRRLYTLNATYLDPVTKTQTRFIAADEVVVFGDLGIVPVFGSIQNKQASFAAMPYFVWQKDCEKTDEVHLESSPLLIPTNVNGALRAKVL